MTDGVAPTHGLGKRFAPALFLALADRDDFGRDRKTHPQGQRENALAVLDHAEGSPASVLAALKPRQGNTATSLNAESEQLHARVRDAFPRNASTHGG